MPTTTFNRKYVYLSPLRALRAIRCVEMEIMRVEAARITLRAKTSPNELDLERVVLLTEDLALLVDIKTRLEQQAQRPLKKRAANSGGMILPDVDKPFFSDEPEGPLVLK